MIHNSPTLVNKTYGSPAIPRFKQSMHAAKFPHFQSPQLAIEQRAPKYKFFFGDNKAPFEPCRIEDGKHVISQK